MKYYKYRSLLGDSRKFTEDILINSNLFFAQPSTFNDPFEFLIKVQTNASRSEFTQYLELSGFDNMPMLLNMTNEQFFEYVTPLLERKDRLGWQSTVNKLKQNCGVLCLSDSATNINMWSQYGDSHKGICFEFESSTPDDFFHHARKVTYLSDPPIVEIIKEYIDENKRRSISEKLVYSKYNTAWDHECEWRIITNQPGPSEFPKECLKAIYLGCQYDLKDPFTDLIKRVRPDVDVILLRKDDGYKISEKWRTKPSSIL